MSKIVIWVLVGIIVVGGGYFALNVAKNSDSKLQKDIVNQTDTNENPEIPSGKKMSFSQFIATEKGAFECTVNHSINNVEGQGKVWVSDGMMRSSYTGKFSGIESSSSMIIRDGYTYSWGSALPGTGFKSRFIDPTKTDINPLESEQFRANFEQIGGYDCQAWTPDESKFIIPSDIVFSELTAPKVEDNKITLIPNNKKGSCESQKGTWYEEGKVCEINSFSENQCIAKGGEWNGCASACRHDKDAQICTLQCVLTCSFR
jgi:hypothetical protein